MSYHHNKGEYNTVRYFEREKKKREEQRGERDYLLYYIISILFYSIRIEY
jgi:hypothetical protein